MFLGLDIVVVLEAVGCQHLLHLLVGTRGNLVNHGPGEGDLRLILKIVEEGLGHESVLHPTLGIGHNASLHLVAVVGAVIHRLDGKRELAVIKTLQEQGANLTHGKDGLQATGQIGLVVGVTFLGDGERNHLE